MDTTTVNIEKYLDIATSEGSVQWQQILKDFLVEDNKKQKHILNTLSFEQLSSLETVICQSKEHVRSNLLKSLKKQLDTIELTNGEALNIFGDMIRSLVISPTDSAPQKPQQKKEKSSEPRKTTRKIKEPRYLNGNISTTKPKIVVSTCANTIDNKKLKYDYLNYLITSSNNTLSLYEIGDNVLLHFTTFNPQELYVVRNKIKNGMPPIHSNPLSNQDPKPAPRTITSFSDLGSLDIKTVSYADKLSEKDEYIAEQEISEELLAEIDGQTKYLK